MLIKCGQHSYHVHDLVRVVHLLTQHFKDADFDSTLNILDVKEVLIRELV